MYAFPAIYIGILRASSGLKLALSILLVATIPLYLPFSSLLLVVMVSFLIVVVIITRVVYISGRNFQGMQHEQDSLLTTVMTFAKTIDARDPYTAFHSNNVAEYGRKIAKELGLSEKETDAVYLAGLIHDIGKIGTPEAILLKEGPLSEAEYEIMKKHSEDGYEIVKSMKSLEALGIPEMMRHHQEKFNGQGYPLGFKGDSIPLGARILAVADAFDAMTTNRSYRSKLAMETAAAELVHHSGTQFDEKVAQALLQVLRRDGQLPKQEKGFVGEVAFGG